MKRGGKLLVSLSRGKHAVKSQWVRASFLFAPCVGNGVFGRGKCYGSAGRRRGRRLGGEICVVRCANRAKGNPPPIGVDTKMGIPMSLLTSIFASNPRCQEGFGIGGGVRGVTFFEFDEYAKSKM